MSETNGKVTVNEEFQLTMTERFALMNALPNQGKVGTARVVRKLVEALEPKASEKEKYGLQEMANGQFAWKSDEATRKLTKKFKFGYSVREFLRTHLSKMSDESKLPYQLVKFHDSLILDTEKETEKDMVEACEDA